MRRRKSFDRKTRKNSANKEVRQKQRTKKHFKFKGYTIVTLPAGATITVIGHIPRDIREHADVSKNKAGRLIKANVDLIMTVDGNGLKNRICHKILFCRPDEKSKGKRVFLPKGLTINQYDVKTMLLSGKAPTYIEGGYTAALLYKDEFLVSHPTKRKHFWITNRKSLKQLANIVRNKRKKKKHAA